MNLGKNKFNVMAVFFVVVFILAPMVVLANSAPVVSNVFAVQRDSSFIVDITYDLLDPDGDWMWVTLYFSPDGGVTWPILCSSVSGDAGTYVTSGTGLRVEWNSRDDYPDLIAATCSIRVVANDEIPYPFISSFWKSDVGGANEIPFAVGDTLAFGHPFRLRWMGTAPSIVGMDPQMLAALDTVYPYDDGLLGYKYDLLDQNCIPSLDDCGIQKCSTKPPGTAFRTSGWPPVSIFTMTGPGATRFINSCRAGISP